MKNSTANVGTRIKDIRTKKGITQSELCGDELTRNHLSLIESGKSLPSLKNVCYIADRLDIPVGYLFSNEENEDARFVSYHASDKIKPLYDCEDFDSCIFICRSIPENLRSDEISMIYAKALFMKAIVLANSSEIQRAKELFAESACISDNCRYLNCDFNNACDYYSKLLNLTNETIIPSELCDIHNISSYVPSELVMYLNMLSGKNVSPDFFKDDTYKAHADAITLMNNGGIYDAFILLEELASNEHLPFYMKYRVFDDLEKCASDVGEFKAAYSAAKKKREFTNR